MQCQAMDSKKFLSWLSGFPAENAKERKEILKEIKTWKICSNEKVAENLCTITEQYLKECDTISTNTALFLTNLIEEVKGCRNAFSLLVPCFIHVASATLQSFANTQHIEIISKTMRLILQILQSYKGSIITHVESPTNCTIQEDFKIIGNDVLEAMTRNDNSLLDTSQMCGTILGYMLSQFKESSSAAKAIITLLHKQNSSFSIKVMPYVSLDVTNLNMTALSEIWLLLGILSCCKPDILLSDDDSKTQLWEAVFNCIVSSCKSMDYVLQYHAFRALKLWWGRSHKLASQTSETHIFLQTSSPFVEASLNLIWRNWDSQISGVPELCTKLFELVLQVNKVAAKDSAELAGLAFNQLTTTSSYVKGKYGVLTVLIKFVGIENFLSKNSTFFESHITCLGKNHLAPIISRLYQCCIEGAKKVKCCTMEHWKSWFAPSLLQALLDNNVTIQKNALHYWILPNLNFHSSVYDELLAMIDSNLHCTEPTMHETHLFVTLGIMKCARCNGLKYFSALDAAVINKGIISFDNAVRSNAWSIVCISHRPSDLITSKEFDLVTEHLPLNFNSDCASFRNELLFCVSSFIQRVVITYCYALKKKASDEYTNRCVKFFKWVLNLCKEGLGSNCSYQRKQIALSVFTYLLQMQDYSKQSKKTRIAPKDMETVIEELKTKGINFRTASEAKLLVTLLQDVVPEVRNKAFELLLKYFSKSILCQFVDVIQKTCENLLHSPKAQDGECGALMLGFLLNIDILDWEVNERPNIYCIFQTFLQTRLLPHLIQHLKQLQTDYLDASYNYPTFGWLLALSKCCDTFATKADTFSETCQWMEMFSIFNPLVENVAKVINHVMTKIFACVGENEEFVASADFQEMSVRILEIVFQDKVNNIGDEQAMLSVDHEVVLASSWLVLKNGCQALTSIVFLLNKLNSSETVGSYLLLLDKVTKMFMSILTSCRHRGVIESCAECLNLLCHHVFRSKYLTITNFAVGLLDEVLKLFSDACNKNFVSGGTVTRRSAGLPLIVESILSACVGTKFSVDLVEKIVKVMATCISELSDKTLNHASENSDIPAVHALYILKHLFKNTTLGENMLCHSTLTFKISLKCLSSHMWLVRNAATHLLGAVSSRMLGQKHIETTDHSSATNSLTLQEFFSWFPEMLQIMIAHLDENSEIIDQRKLLGPSIFPIISILSKLSNCQDLSSSENLHVLLDSLPRYLTCPSFAVRRSCAQATLGLNSIEKVILMASSFLDSIPYDKWHQGTLRKPMRQNTLHGWLDLMYEIFKQCKICEGTNHDLLPICQLLFERQWLGNIFFNKCPYTATLFIKIFGLAMKISSEGTSTFQESLLQVVLYSKDVNTKQVGFFEYLEEAVLFILNKANTDKFFELLECLFGVECPKISLAVLRWIYISLKPEHKFLSMERTLKMLLKYMEQSTSLGPENVQIFSDILLLVGENVSFEVFMAYSSKLQQLPKSFKKLSCTCSNILSLSCLVEYQLKTLNAKDLPEACHITEWIFTVSKHTYINQASEPLRLASASGLCKIGHKVLQYLTEIIGIPNVGKEKVEEYLNLASSIYKTALGHLHDEQSNIREEACKFVSYLTSSTVICYPSVATKQLLAHIKEQISHHCHTMGMLLEFVMEISCLPVLNSSSLSLFEQEAFNLFVEPCFVAKEIIAFVKELLNHCIDIPSPWWQTNYNIGCLRLKHIVDCLPQSGSRLWLDSAICTLIHLNFVIENVPQNCISLQQTKNHMIVLQKVHCPPLQKYIINYWQAANKQTN